LFGYTENQLNGTEKDTIDGRYGVTPRQVLQIIGTQIGIKLHHGFWIEQFHQFIKESECKVVIVSDVRFKDEVDAIACYSDSLLLLVDRSKHIISTHENSSENLRPLLNQGKKWGILRYIDNNGTFKQLESRLKIILDNSKHNNF
jgi:hypothetical protein